MPKIPFTSSVLPKLFLQFQICRISLVLAHNVCKDSVGFTTDSFVMCAVLVIYRRADPSLIFAAHGPWHCRAFWICAQHMCAPGFSAWFWFRFHLPMSQNCTCKYRRQWKLRGLSTFRTGRNRCQQRVIRHASMSWRMSRNCPLARTIRNANDQTLRAAPPSAASHQ